MNSLELEQSQEIEEVSAIQTVAGSRADLIEACRTSLDFIASLILTEVYQYGYPPLFHAIWQMLCGAALQVRGKPKYAIGIPRGFSKTVILKLYVVWCVLFTDRRFILIICNTEKLAFNFLKDVADMLDSPNIKAIFGDWRAKMYEDNNAQKTFSFRGRDINLAAIGSGGSLRGLNLKYVRPDVVVMDDMQNRDEAGNPDIAKEKLIWMLGTLMKACHPQRCVYIFVGNMYPFEGSILRKLKHSDDWVSFITGAILSDGKSLWPEHRPLEDLMAELKSDTDMGHPELFFSEVMNDEDSGTVSGIDVSKIPDCPHHLDIGQAQGGFIIIDPSLGKKKSDDVGIGAILMYDGLPVLKELRLGKFDPMKTIQEATFMAVKFQMQLICVEAVAYQATLIFWFNFVYQQLNIEGMQVGEVSTGGMQKNARIREALKLLLAGKILLHKDVRSAVIYQITQWNPLKTVNKDEILDILAYIYQVMERHQEWIPLRTSELMQEAMPEGVHSSSGEMTLAF